MARAREEELEKVLFVSVDVNALGVSLEPDARGNAAVVKSMLTPLQVESSQLDRKRGGAAAARREQGPALLEVGDVLFAINGHLVHETRHEEVVAMLRVDSLSASELLTMLVLSFMDPFLYYRKVRAKALRTVALADERLFGRLDLQSASKNAAGASSGWRGYLPGWGLWAAPAPRAAAAGAAGAAGQTSPGSAPAVPSPAKPSTLDRWWGGAARSGTDQGVACLRFAAGDFKQALQAYTAVLEREPLNHTVRVSRSLCYLRLGDSESALRDALTCCALKPEWPMPYVCQGAALDAMGRPLEACGAYVRGLVVDPLNAVLRGRLNGLFDRMEWTCIALDGKQVVGSVASAVMQRREEWDADLLVDRIVLYGSGDLCKKHLFEMEPHLTLLRGGRRGPVKLRVPDTARYEEAVAALRSQCELFDGDEVLSVNSATVRNLAHLRQEVERSQGVVMVGILSGARIAATELLEKEYAHKAEATLGARVASTLFNVHVSACGREAANGPYVPQETKNGAFVFENKAGCLLSVESVRGPDGWRKALVIGLSGAVLYAAPLDEARVQEIHVNRGLGAGAGAGAGGSNGSSGAHKPGAVGARTSHRKVTDFSGSELLELLRSARWVACPGEGTTPVFDRTNIVPSLGFFIGEDTDAAELEETDIREWTADVQILAIKGFGNRAFARHDFELALMCFVLVQDQIEALLGEVGSGTDVGSPIVTVPAARAGAGSAADDAGTESAESGAEDATETEPSSGEGESEAQDPAGSASYSAGSRRGLEKALVEAKRSYEEERQLEADATLRVVLIKVLVSAAQAYLEVGKPRESLESATRACATAAKTSMQTCPLALYQRSLALVELLRLDDALRDCQRGLDALCSSDSALKQRMAGLRKELLAQGAKLSSDAAASPRGARPGPLTTVPRSPASASGDGKRRSSATSLPDMIQSPRDMDGAESPAGTIRATRSFRSASQSLGRLFVQPDPDASADARNKRREALSRGLRLLRITELGAGKEIAKVKLLRASQDGASLVIASVSKMRGTLRPSARRVARRECAGVVLGKVTDVEPAPRVAHAPSHLSIVTQSGSVHLFRAKSAAEAEVAALVLAEFLAPRK